MVSTNTSKRLRASSFLLRTVDTVGNGESITHDFTSEFQGLSSTSGQENPFWKTFVEMQLSATTPFTGYEWKRLQSNKMFIDQFWEVLDGAPPFITTKIIADGKIDIPFDNAHYVARVDAIPIGTADNEARGRLINSIRSKQVTFQGGQFLGELGQTVRLLRNPAKSLFKRVGGYLKRLKSKARNLRRLPPRLMRQDIADTWLEASFGWRPLLSEIDDGAKAASEIMSEASSRGLEVAVGLGEQSGRLDPKLDLHWPGGTTPHMHLRRRTLFETRVKYVSYLKTKFTSSVGTYTTLGLGPKEFIPTLWELLPWSFVVDYFTNIGEMIASISYGSTQVRFTNRTVHRTLKVNDARVSEHFQGIGAWHTSTTTKSSASSGVVLELVKVERTNVIGSLAPSLAFTMPNSSTKWLNLAALGTLMKSTTRSLL